jgi:hypothetical protein
LGAPFIYLLEWFRFCHKLHDSHFIGQPLLPRYRRHFNPLDQSGLHEYFRVWDFERLSYRKGNMSAYIRYVPNALGGGGGGGSATPPGGSNTDVQYNSLGSFAGSPNFTFDGSNVVVSGNVTAGGLISNGNITGLELILNGTTSGTVSLIPPTTFTSYNFNLPTTPGTSGQLLTSAGGLGAPMTWTSPGSGGVGTVTSVSIVSSNGFAGTVANPTTTPAITLSTTITSPVLAGNGTAIIAATLGNLTDSTGGADGITVTNAQAQLLDQALLLLSK